MGLHKKCNEFYPFTQFKWEIISIILSLVQESKAEGPRSHHCAWPKTSSLPKLINFVLFCSFNVSKGLLICLISFILEQILDSDSVLYSSKKKEIITTIPWDKCLLSKLRKCRAWYHTTKTFSLPTAPVSAFHKILWNVCSIACISQSLMTE